MSVRSSVGAAARWSAAAIGLAAGAYALYVGTAWYRYGRASRPAGAEGRDDLLERFMPAYEVRTWHEVSVAAPAAITLAAAREMDLAESCVARMMFRGRELILGSTPDDRPRPRGLLAEVRSLGWGVLAEIPDREVVVGAVTQPWKANVVFRAIPPEQLLAFNEPGYVKIVWTLRADPDGPASSIFRSETRVATTDAAARARFRWYWSFFSPGMVLIRRASLGPVKREAERRARETALERTPDEARGVA